MHLLCSLTAARSALIALAMLTCAHAQKPAPEQLLALASVFTDHMVVQRDRPFTVWGTTSPGAEVLVTFGRFKHADQATPSGSFAVTLPKQAANATGQALSIRAQLGNRTEQITLHDVVIGDLWLCSGQSNMRWRVHEAAEANDLLDGADTKVLRLLDFEGELYPSAQRYDLEFLKKVTKDNYYKTTGWQRASRDSARTFSAVAFVFGQRLAHDAGVPIGLIHNAIGGAPMAAFLPGKAPAMPASVAEAMRNWWRSDGYPTWCRTRVRQNLNAWFEQPTGNQPHHPFEPSFLFDAGIAPLRHLPIRGVVWYQGESDATDIPGDRRRDVDHNHAMFTALIAAFRANWNDPELPFYFAQLPGLNRDWPTFREMQARVAAEDAFADMAVTIDVGHPTDVHPRQKAPVGNRLAQLALADIYGKLVATSGPRFARLVIEGPRAIVHYDHADGLRTIDNKPVREFAIAGADKRFYPALAAIVGPTIVLTSTSVAAPTAVRYAFSSNPQTNLVNRARLPAHPFRTDTWKHATAVAAGASDSGSFEDAAAGPLRKARVREGTWQAAAGHAELTSKFARTGKQCLHLHGGADRTATITLAQRGARRLSFWAERWTSRPPFAFRVEARTGNKWSEVFNGDKVRVGARFLSHVAINLPENVTALRFRSTSPDNSGVLIDDLELADAQPMRLLGAYHRLWVAPALRGKTSTIAKVAIPTAGDASPLRINGCTVTFSEGTDLTGIAKVHALGQSKAPSRQMLFSGDRPLAPGHNEIAIAVDLAAEASLKGRITATVTDLSLADGRNVQPIGAGTPQRIGVALRTAGQDDCHTYRIPGLVTTTVGTLIAVYDNRYRGGGDLPGDVDVGMSRSTDGGGTWEAMRVVMDMGRDPKWRYDGIGDPAVLVDRVTGRIWIAATWSHGNRSWNGSGPGMLPEETGQLMLVHSDDDGRTWSKPTNITAQIKDPSWRFVLQGPGRGITMRDGTIVLAAQYRSAPDGPHEGKPFSTMLSSRDHGETWQIGNGVKIDTTEAQLVELDDGVLMINCRDNRRGSRSIYTTKDLGKSWQRHPTSRSALIEPTCMASLLRLDHEELGRLLVFSNPNTAAGRFDMTLKISDDNGNTWPSRWHTRYDQRPGAGYSCLTRIDDEHIGVVYEGQRELYFLRFSIRELAKP